MYFRQLHRSTFYVKFVWAVYSVWVMKPAWGCANEAAVQTPPPLSIYFTIEAIEWNLIYMVLQFTEPGTCTSKEVNQG